MAVEEVGKLVLEGVKGSLAPSQLDTLIIQLGGSNLLTLTCILYNFNPYKIRILGAGGEPGRHNTLRLSPTQTHKLYKRASHVLAVNS